METLMTVVTATLAVLAGLVLVAAGAFSLLSLLWDDLLESDRCDQMAIDCQEVS